MAKITEILCNNSSIYDLVLQDLGGPDTNEVGARGMTAEQVLRAAIIKQMEGYSYRTFLFTLSTQGLIVGFAGSGSAGRSGSRPCSDVLRLYPTAPRSKSI